MVCPTAFDPEDASPTDHRFLPADPGARCQRPAGRATEGSRVTRVALATLEDRAAAAVGTWAHWTAMVRVPEADGNAATVDHTAGLSARGWLSSTVAVYGTVYAPLIAVSPLAQLTSSAVTAPLRAAPPRARRRRRRAPPPAATPPVCCVPVWTPDRPGGPCGPCGPAEPRGPFGPGGPCTPALFQLSGLSVPVQLSPFF